MKEPIVLLKAIKRGCYSDSEEERENSKGGILIREGSRYTYGSDPLWMDGQGFYSCNTHIILEKDIDWNIFCMESEYYKIIDLVRKQIIEKINQ